jgi:peptide/nickel transport system substrate-binding protein
MTGSFLLPLSRANAQLLRRCILIFVAVALLASGCGGKKAGEAEQVADEDAPEAVESGLDDAGEPVRGGTLVYALEAETTGGFCLPDAVLAISGIMVARNVYDTLMVPNADGEYVPWLAESVENNATYDEWTIKLREGIKFHDGTDLDAEVVKNNLDAVRGKDPDRPALLGSSVFHNINTVDVVDPLTLRVTTHVPWVAFPAYLWSSGRYGILAQRQLDDPDDCNKDLIGTGPFKFEEWNQNQYLRLSRNENYWREAPDGKPYPYLDKVEFRPIAEGEQRVNALESGEIQALHTSSSRQTLRLRGLRDDGKANLTESTKFAEVGYAMLNASKPPFDDIRMRRAVQMGFDRKRLTEMLGEGLPTLANGPFAEGVLGHLDDSGWPEYDADEARRLIEEYRVDKGLDKVRMSLNSTSDPEIQEIAVALEAEAEDLNLDVKITVVEQSKLINDAIGGNYEATLFRNHPGGDPDTQYVWWKSQIRDEEGKLVDNFVNFGRIRDTEIDRLLDEGRSEVDPTKRQEIYEDLSRRFADMGWNAWLTFTRWVVATAPSVHGVYGPELPDGSAPNPGLATGHTLMGMWTTDKG